MNRLRRYAELRAEAHDLHAEERKFGDKARAARNEADSLARSFSLSQRVEQNGHPAQTFRLDDGRLVTVIRQGSNGHAGDLAIQISELVDDDG